MIEFDETDDDDTCDHCGGSGEIEIDVEPCDEHQTGHMLIECPECYGTGKELR